MEQKNVNLSMVDYLSTILGVIDFLKKHQSDTKHAEKDVRRTFFAKTANAVRVYYLGHDFEFLVSKVKANGNFPNEEVRHIENLGWIMPQESNARFLHAYHSILKLNLINGAWVCFESSVDEVFKTVIPADIRDKLEHRSYHQVIGLLQKLNVAPGPGESQRKDIDDRLRKILRNKHIPINSKWDAILKLCYADGRDLRQDKDFLEFFQSCRNCMHNNSISFKTAKFATRLGEFQFDAGKAIDFITPVLIVEMVRELASIYDALCGSLAYDNVIIDTYSSQVE